MKKLFTLLTLLVFLGGGKSWGAESTTKIDFESGTIADVFTETNSSGVTTSLEATASYEWKSGYKFSSFPTGSTKLFVTSLGSTKGTSTTLVTKSSWEGIKSISFYIASSDRGKTELAVMVSPNADFSSDVTTVLTQTTLSSTNFGSTSNGTMKQMTFNLAEAKSGYVKIVLAQASSSNNKIMSLDDIVITNDPSAIKTATNEVLATSAAVKVDDTPLTLDAATSGYSVSSNTITLSDDVTSLSTPDNVKLVKTVTYDDSSVSNEDVDVTFGGTVTDGYYIGTATIGLTGSATEYTVKVKKDVTPTLTLSASSGSISLKSYEPTGTAKVTLTGANLANGTFTAPTASGVTVTPATWEITDGTINKEFTITSTATTAAETVLAFAYTGATTQNYTLNYSKTAQRSVSQSTISAATTWDWTDAGDNSIELNASTSPTNADEFIMAEIAEVEKDLEFNSEALKVVCQFPTRGSYHYFQGNSVKFTTSVAGVVKVWFSNTSDRTDSEKNRRYLYINGSNTGVYTLNQTFTTASLYVPAGEVVINAYTGEGTPNATMIRIQKIQFDDAALTDADEVTVSSAGYATFVLTQDAYFDATDGVTAYAAKANGETIKLTEVKAAPASTPLVIKAAAGTYTLKKATSISPADVSTDINDLVASDGTVVGDGASHYVLGKEGSTVGFGPLASDITLASGKAYIPASKFGSAPSRAFYEIDIDGVSTGINMVNGEGLKVNGSETYYDLQGRRILYPTKGLYIVNGKKVVIK